MSQSSLIEAVFLTKKVVEKFPHMTKSQSSLIEAVFLTKNGWKEGIAYVGLNPL